MELAHSALQKRGKPTKTISAFRGPRTSGQEKSGAATSPKSLWSCSRKRSPPITFVLGGGNSKKLDTLPAGARPRQKMKNAFLGGFPPLGKSSSSVACSFICNIAQKRKKRLVILLALSEIEGKGRVVLRP